jgi:putative transposase
MLIHNQMVRISSGAWEGMYRVVVDAPRMNKTILVKLTEQTSSAQKTTGRKKMAVTKSPRKKAPLPLIGDMIWAEHAELNYLEKEGLLLIVDVEREQFKLSQSDHGLYLRRTEVMSDFLDFDKLSTAILDDGGVGGLVNAAVAASGASRSLLYKLWSLLCRFGFSAGSLKPRRDRCGAPGVIRPCDPDGSQKAGRKTSKQRVARASGKLLPPAQPGMSTEWRHWIIIADKKIPSPKPDFPARYNIIIDSKFVRRYRQENSALIPLELKQGEYPNRSQVKRVLNTEVPRLQRLLERTTTGHFARSLRGMTGRNWKGVAGPGHTWAIDSTIGDIYLRSSVNRAWIIGRPVVYIIVDVWSTAIVGFYVCLTGPSWDTAKVSLFSAAAEPTLLADLWQYQPILSLYPAPTLPAALMCDRGEYLSRAASETAVKLIPCMSYAPPYRPDMKGLVEVLHRVEKDRQHLWVPGAIDARRQEYELRRFNPHDAVLTVREYTEYLHTVFAEYNLTADRVKRIDTHMAAAGVMPSPAGLWRWGHAVGIGTRRSFPQSELVSTLLPLQSGTVSRTGVNFCGLHYESEKTNDEQWTAHARNFGSWKIDISHFPGSVSRIWTPNLTGAGLLDLRLSQQTLASKEQTFDEVLDAFMIRNLSVAEIEHAKVLQMMKSHQRMEALIAGAKANTEEAIARYKGTTPTMTESRQMETKTIEGTLAEPNLSITRAIDEANADYLDMMKSAFAAANIEGGL